MPSTLENMLIFISVSISNVLSKDHYCSNLFLFQTVTSLQNICSRTRLKMMMQSLQTSLWPTLPAGDRLIFPESITSCGSTMQAYTDHESISHPASCRSKAEPLNQYLGVFSISFLAKIGTSYQRLSRNAFE